MSILPEILGVDAGNSSIKVVGKDEPLLLPSALGEYRERKLDQKFSDDDIIYSYNGRKGFAGTLAINESQLLASRMGDSKAHEEMLVRVLLGIFQYSHKNEFDIVVGQPIAKHTKQEKDKMKKLLKGEHEITVNGNTRKITINNIEIASEAGASFWSNPRKGLVRIIDVGSGTVNAATLNDGKYIDKDSFTIGHGLETILVDDMESFARKIAIQSLNSWSPKDNVLICGGGYKKVLPFLKEYFHNISALYPNINNDDDIKVSVNLTSPIYANAVGFYNIAKKVFE